MPLFSVIDRAVMDEVFGGTNWAPPATLYFGLSTTAPNKDATGVTEPSGGNYARVAITNNATNFPASTTSTGTTTKQNGTVITFNQANASWGTPNYWVIYADLTATTNPIAYGTVTTPKAIGSGDTPSFSANGIQVTMQ